MPKKILFFLLLNLSIATVVQLEYFNKMEHRFKSILPYLNNFGACRC